MASASRSTSRRCLVIGPRQRTARPGPGKGCRQTVSSGKPNSLPSVRTSSLNRSLSGSISSKPNSAGRPPTLWCVLVVAAGAARGGAVGGGAAFDHVGIQRALCQKTRVGDMAGLVLEYVDEDVADDAPLFLRIADAGQGGEETVGGIHEMQVGVKVVAEGLADLV